MGKLTNIRPPVSAMPSRLTAPPKTADGELLTAEHRMWREQVLAKAGFRCEAIDKGRRCERRAPMHRLFADHIIERSDGGAALDPANGQCLCGMHHSRKTARARLRRAHGSRA